VHLPPLDSSQPVIDSDVAYAFQVGQAHLGFSAARSGSQWRLSEAAEFFETAGFGVMCFEANTFADEITERSRLRNCARLVDSFAFAGIRRIRPPGTEAR
jgi:hypothetical protein